MNKISFVGRCLANAIYANVSSAEIDAKKAPFSLIDGSLPKYILGVISRNIKSGTLKNTLFRKGVTDIKRSIGRLKSDRTLKRGGEEDKKG